MLLADNRYSKVTIFVRNRTILADEKLEEIVVDFNRIDDYAHHIKGDDLFCCIGTTQKKAGSKEAFRNVDFKIPANLARIAATNKIPSFLVVSSIGAKATSSNFYLHVKGEMEAQVQKMNIPKTIILRPSLLLGERKEYRFAEELAKKLSPVNDFFMVGRLKKYRSIKAKDVARAMIKLAHIQTNKVFWESDQIQKTANDCTYH